MAFKIPRSVLVVIYTTDASVLLLERSSQAGFWQSVTGSVDTETESLWDTAVREVAEETGIDVLSDGCVLSDWDLENV